jgi:hypothetical protein
MIITISNTLIHILNPMSCHNRMVITTIPTAVLIHLPTLAPIQGERLMIRVIPRIITIFMLSL